MRVPARQRAAFHVGDAGAEAESAREEKMVAHRHVPRTFPVHPKMPWPAREVEPPMGLRARAERKAKGNGAAEDSAHMKIPLRPRVCVPISPMAAGLPGRVRRVTLLLLLPAAAVQGVHPDCPGYSCVGTATERATTIISSARDVLLDGPWGAVREALLGACGLRVGSKTSHCFDDFNHVDCCAMQQDLTHNTNEQSRVLFATVITLMLVPCLYIIIHDFVREADSSEGEIGGLIEEPQSAG